MSKLNTIKKFLRKCLCKMNIHVSDRQFTLRWHDKAITSDCKHCKTTIVHPRLKSYGGGN